MVVGAPETTGGEPAASPAVAPAAAYGNGRAASGVAEANGGAPPATTQRSSPADDFFDSLLATARSGGGHLFPLCAEGRAIL